MSGFKTKKVIKDNLDVVRAFRTKEVKEFASKYELDFDSIQLNEYQGTKKYSVTIPVKDDADTVLLIVLDKEDSTKIAARVITMHRVDGNLAISFNSVDFQNTATGIYNENFELLRVEAKAPGAITIQADTSCFMDAFNSLPWFMKAICEGSCAGCLGAIAPACAACAGCLGGTALHCVL